MKILCTIILCFFFLETTPPTDLGLPQIQAVCKVKLKNGETIEGFIVFGFGGYGDKYRYNGFCFISDSGYKQLKFYNFHYKLSNLNSSSSGNRTTTLQYVKNISDTHYQQPLSEYNKDTKVLTRTYTDVQKYKLLDHMELYTSLPSSLNLGYYGYIQEENGDGKILIDVRTLKSVELVKEPSERVLKIIETARKKQQLSEKEEPWTDYNPPVWYHEIIKDKKKFDYLSPHF